MFVVDERGLYSAVLFLPTMASAVFAELNAKKDNAAAGLNKVTDDMKTKNRPDEPALAPVKAGTTASASATAPKKPEKKAPSLKNEKGTWFCENYVGQDEPVKIENASMKENIYIGSCKNVSVLVSGKVKSITVTGCNNVQVQFDAVVSTFEVIGSAKVKIFVMQACPTASVAKSTGVNFILMADAAPNFGVLYYSQSSEVLVTAPGKTQESDPQEFAVSEQIQVTYKRNADGTNTFTEEIVRHHG